MKSDIIALALVSFAWLNWFFYRLIYFIFRKKNIGLDESFDRNKELNS